MEYGKKPKTEWNQTKFLHKKYTNYKNRKYDTVINRFKFGHSKLTSWPNKNF